MILRILTYLSVIPFILGQIPNILTATKVGIIPSPFTLNPIGGDSLILRGTNFGTTGPISLVYNGKSPFSSALLITYTPTITFRNNTFMQITIPPGIGSQLTFNINVNGQVSTSSILAGYSAPIITGLTVPLSSLNTITNLNPSGGDYVIVNGTNFGPKTFPGSVFIHTPAIRYGGTTANYNYFYGCSRDNIYYNTVMTCRVPAGAGFNHSLIMIFWNTGVQSVVTRSILSYALPIITSVSNSFSTMNTAGNELVYLRGNLMPFPPWLTNGWVKVNSIYGILNNGTQICSSVVERSNAILTCPIGSTIKSIDFASYGTPTGICGNYQKSTCNAINSQNIVGSLCLGRQTCTVSATNSIFSDPCVRTSKRLSITATCTSSNLFNKSYTTNSCTGGYDVDGKTPLIVCQTVSGTGTNFGVAVYVTNTLASVYYKYPQPIGYGSPVISYYTGDGSINALTTGNQSILINGINFGNSTNVIQVSYNTILKQPVNNISTLQYNPLSCSIFIPNTVIQCFTNQGVGKDLTWKIIVDGQTNINPVTSYIAPMINSLEVRNSTDYTLKSGASTNGGDLLFINGSGFGPSSLNTIQAISVISSQGTQITLPSNTYNLTSDNLIITTIPAGGGSNWRTQVQIADLINSYSTATFSYMQPSISQIIPNYGLSTGTTNAIIYGNNLPLSIATIGIGIVFGNPSDGSLYQNILPTNLVPTPDNNPSITTPYLPNQVSFNIPPGIGLGRAVRIVSYLISDGVPDPTTITTIPYDYNCLNCLNDTIDVFNYNNPFITSIIVSRPITPDEINTATNFFSYDAVVNNTIRILTLFGNNFGLGSYGNSNINRLIEEEIISTWYNNYNYKFLITDWNDNNIKLYTLSTVGQVRIKIQSNNFNGDVLNQTSNGLSFSDYSPLIIINNSTNYPTVGGGILSFQGMYLASATSFNITILNNPCQILNPSGQVITSDSDIFTQLLNNPAVYSPSGPFTPNTVWNLRCIVPIGQGINAPVIMLRKPDNSLSSQSNTINYIPPTIIQIGTSNFGSIPVMNPINSFTRYLVNTNGGLVKIIGDNFGICPTIQIATYTISYCDDMQNPLSPFYDLNSYLSSDQTIFEFSAPPGEGIGTDPSLAGITGWTFNLNIGGQSQTNGIILFGWNLPTVQNVYSESNPTLGGTMISLSGLNFGQSLPGYPQSSLPDNIKLGVQIGSILTGYNNCLDINRISHNQINCTLPIGAGSANIVLTVAGQTYTGTDTILYNKPSILLASSNGGINNTQTSSLIINGNTDGNYFIHLNGNDFGKFYNGSSCIFMMSISYSYPLNCNGYEDNIGEGEVWSDDILTWNDTDIIFRSIQGTGIVQFVVYEINQYNFLGSSVIGPKLQYNPPILSTSLSPSSGSTDGNTMVTLNGINFGFYEKIIYPASLPIINRPTNNKIRVNWGPFDNINSIIPTGACISNNDNYCQQGIININNNQIQLSTLPGVGTNISISVSIIDELNIYVSNYIYTFNYDPPIINFFNPNPIRIGNINNPIIRVQGLNFGSAIAFNIFKKADQTINLIIDNNPLSVSNPMRVQNNGIDLGVQFILQGQNQQVGNKDASIFIAGQNGFLNKNNSNSLLVVCDINYFGKPNEVCLLCPVGASCAGYFQIINNTGTSITSSTSNAIGVHSYPIPLAGYFNLNSSYIGADACPASSIIINNDGSVRDVCIVPCNPATSCLGNNLCSYGYTNVAPSFRCSTCAAGFYKSSSDCIKCPDSPYMLFVGFFLVVIFLAAAGYFLNKYNVNIAFLSIGVDYFQVLAIFLQTKVAWPPAVKNLYSFLSAFNLNIEIVAPECLVPQVSYTEKFSFILMLPISLIILLYSVHSLISFYRYYFKGNDKKRSIKNFSFFYSNCIVLMYLFYLYVTKTILDIFNCAPTVPPTYDSNGKVIEYLQVVFQQCGKPGGIQMTLMPYAIIGILVYTIGYPSIIGMILWKNRENIILDQYLRAKNTGDDRLSNPYSYDLRKSFSRLYYQFKPDFIYWSIVIIIRKFGIALTSVMFTANASFQMAACLLIMFLAYALQLKCNPYMSPIEYDSELMKLNEKTHTSPYYVKINIILKAIQGQSRKRGAKSIMTREGKIDKYALVSNVGLWIFNFNTVEAVLLFCSVIISLMGIMYQTLGIYDTTGKDAITSVVITVISLSILYLVSVLIAEIWLALKNNNEHKDVSKLLSKRKLVGVTLEMVQISKSEMNPMLMNRTTVDGDDMDKIIQEQIEVPPLEIWMAFKDAFILQSKQIKELSKSLTEYKINKQREDSVNFFIKEENNISRIRKEFISKK